MVVRARVHLVWQARTDLATDSQYSMYDRKRSLCYVRGVRANLLLEFFPKRSGEIGSIDFGNGFVLAQEGCN